jgi:hypothetical protein
LIKPPEYLIMQVEFISVLATHRINGAMGSAGEWDPPRRFVPMVTIAFTSPAQILDRPIAAPSTVLAFTTLEVEHVVEPVASCRSQLEQDVALDLLKQATACSSCNG